MVNTSSAGKFDERFSYGDTKPGHLSHKQYITGNEIVTILPRGSPTTFDWGGTYEFPIEDLPILISDKNHLQIRYKVQARKKPTQQVTEPWRDYTMTVDSDSFYPVENFGSAFIEEVSMRQGLDPLETDGFVPRGRYLYENFVMAHTTRKVRQTYSYTKRDPALFCYQNRNVFKPKTLPFESCFGAGQPRKVADTALTSLPGLEQETWINVVPHALPFQYRNRSTMHDTLFPNTGNPLTICIKLHSSYRHLHAKEKDTTVNEYRFLVTGMQLVLAVPRFSKEG